MADDSNKPDLIIRNARIVDGSGGPSRHGDVAVSDDRIAGVGDLGDRAGASEIDAGGRALAPGFIDPHTHDDRALLADPLMACKASQGVTTVVAGNCGISLAPLTAPGRPPAPLDLICEDGAGFFADFGAYLDALDTDPPAINAVAQVGHSTLRYGAMDRLDRPATAAEVKAMRTALEAALAAGAVGLSTGLFYPTAKAAPTEEVVALAGALHDARAVHSTHMRDEADHIVESLQETFHIGRAADVAVVISHHKCVGWLNHGRTPETLALIDAARAQQPIGLDVYPYTAGSTMLASGRQMAATVPRRVLRGMRKAAGLGSRPPQRIIVTWSRAMPEAAGRDLGDVAAELGVDWERAIDLLSPAGGIFFTLDEADVRRVLAYPYSMIGSDGLPHDAHPHPRLWGTFPRVLGHYVREVGLFTLEQAVHKMTGLTAAQFGLRDRGAIREGAYADLVLFDPERVIDRATFEDPIQPAAGIDLVLVNGRAVWRDGAHTGARPGRALRRQDLDPPRAAAGAAD